MIAFLLGTVLPWILIAGGAWLGYQLVRQNGRILLRLEAIDKQLGSHRGSGPAEPGREARGLSVGTLAPDFELLDLAGTPRKLSEFRGRDVLLIFFNPKCGYCTKMADDLAALAPNGGDGWAVPVVATTGDADENRMFVERHGIRCAVLLQEQMEVAAKFRAQGTPMGYRIDAAGRIASELTVGAEPLLQLADLRASHHHAAGGTGGTGNGSASHGTQSDLPRSQSPEPQRTQSWNPGSGFPVAADRRRRVVAGRTAGRAGTAGVF
jgi:peroxiredoxin